MPPLGQFAVDGVMHKVCGNCRKEGRPYMLPVTEFGQRKARSSEHGVYYRSYCKRCAVDRQSARYRDNVNGCRDLAREAAARRTPQQKRAQDLWKHYRMSIDEFDRLLSAQDGRCAICKTDAPSSGVGVNGPSRGWHVDHDHTTGAVRGVLCGPCNMGLGHFKDSADALRNAISYLDGVKNGK